MEDIHEQLLQRHPRSFFVPPRTHQFHFQYLSPCTKEDCSNFTLCLSPHWFLSTLSFEHAFARFRTVDPRLMRRPNLVQKTLLRERTTATTRAAHKWFNTIAKRPCHQRRRRRRRCHVRTGRAPTTQHTNVRRPRPVAAVEWNYSNWIADILVRCAGCAAVRVRQTQ